MSILSRFRILTKIMAVIVLLSAVAIGITALGVNALKSLSDATDVMEAAGKHAIIAAHMNQAVVALNRAEYRIASDPRPENVNAARKDIEDTSRKLMSQWDEVATTDDAAAKKILAEAKEDWVRYRGELDGTLKVADEIKDFQITEQQERLQRELKASLPVAKKFNDNLLAVSSRLDALVSEVSRSATDEYLHVSRLMMIAATVGIVLGTTFGIMIGQFGVAKPIRVLVGLLQRMAKGEEVEITGTERKDEIGDTANAVNAIRVMVAEKAQQEADAKAQFDRKAAEEKAERDRVAAAEKAQRAEQERIAAAEKAEEDRKATAEIGAVVQAAMAGDFSQRLPLEGKEGVIRNLADAMNTMCDNIGKVMDDLVVMMGALAEGDLTKRISASYEGTFATLKDSANTTAEKLSETVSGIKGAAEEVTNAAAEISTSTTDLSQRTEEQAAGLEETSASMEEISATVKKNAENAQQANQLTAGAREVADRGGAVVASTVEAMSRIEDSSNKIADIIGVIDEIARQTNLLALNAAVEAARAGDAGRGFAVVASEVRSLAQRSSQAAKDIKDLITSSSTQVKDGVDLVNRTGTSLNEIVRSIKEVADIVADIANASVEQATGIDQVNKALAQMDEVTQQNSALVEENAATAKTLESQAAAMTQQVSFFSLDQRAQRVVPLPLAAKPVARPAQSAKRGSVVGRIQSRLATAMKPAAEFEEF